MKKRNRYLIILIALLIFSTGLVFAKGQKEETKNEGVKKEAVKKEDKAQAASTGRVRIGYPGTLEAMEQFMPTLANALKVACESLGGELITADFDFSAEGLIKSVEQLLSQNIDVLFFYNLADQLMPPIQAMCDKAGVAYLGQAPIGDEMWAELSKDPLFLGTVYEENKESSYEMIKYMAELGVTNLLVLSAPAGNLYAEERKVGLGRAVKETGIKLLPIAENILSADDVAKAVENTIITYPEMDGIFIMSSYVTEVLPSTMKILENRGLTKKVIVGGYDHGYADQYIENGLNFIYMTMQNSKMSAGIAACINYAKGVYKYTGPVKYQVNVIKMTTKSELDNYAKIFGGPGQKVDVPVMTPEEYKAALSDAGPKEIQAWLGNYTVGYIQKLQAAR